MGHTEAEIASILERYAAAGVSNILALRGDPPRDQPDYDHTRDTFPQAVDLVRFIKKFSGHPDKRGFGIGVAGFPEGHPATPNRLLEMDYLKAKVDAGADYICTQLFFDNHDFYDFRDRCALAGIEAPIIPGIMPIISLKRLHRVLELTGEKEPSELARALASEDPNLAKSAGIEFAAKLVSDLVAGGVQAVHLYAFNEHKNVTEVLRRAKIVS